MFKTPQKSIGRLSNSTELNPFLRKNLNRSILQTAKRRYINRDKPFTSNSVELSTYLQVRQKEAFAFVGTFSPMPSTQKKKVYINVGRPFTSSNSTNRGKKGVLFMQYMKTTKIKPFESTEQDNMERNEKHENKEPETTTENKGLLFKKPSKFVEEMSNLYGKTGMLDFISSRLHSHKIKFNNTLSNVVQSKVAGKCQSINPEKVTNKLFSPSISGKTSVPEKNNIYFKEKSKSWLKKHKSNC